MIDDLGHGGQPLSMADAAATFGQQWADLADSPSDGGTIYPKPGRQDIVRRGVPQRHQRDQQTIHEHELVLSARSDGSLPCSLGQSGFLTCLPYRAELGHQIRQHVGRQASHPALKHHTRTIHGKIISTKIHNHARGRKASQRTTAGKGTRASENSPGASSLVVVQATGPPGSPCLSCIKCATCQRAGSTESAHCTGRPR